MGGFTNQRRLAASVMYCGANRVRFNPAENAEIRKATSRQAIRELVSNRKIVQKPKTVVSHARHRLRADRIHKGRHCGTYHKFGTRAARTDPKKIWRLRLRCLRSTLRKILKERPRIMEERNAACVKQNKPVETMEIADPHLYRRLYRAAKGNKFKSRRALLDHIRKEQEAHRLERVELANLEMLEKEKLDRAREVRAARRDFRLK